MESPYRPGARAYYFLIFGLLLVPFLEAATPNGSPKSRPNILWLIAEDFGVDLGCYGTKEVWSPNLDKLAQEGMRFTRAYTTAPVCSPSRSALITGMYQTSIDAHNHRSHRDDGYQPPAGVRLITDRLRDAGYFTANLRQLPETIGFKGTGKTDWNFSYSGKPFDSDQWKDLKSRQPFYAQINFKETHRAFVSPRRADPAKVEIPPYYPDHPVTRLDWAKYLDSASELDVKVGQILKQLEADGLAQNTVVIFMADNGQAHVRGKQFVYESGLHIPLIIRWPRNLKVPKNYQAGKVSDQLLESIDLTATTLALAGVAKPEKMQGRVFLGDQSEKPRRYVFGARDRCDETVFRLRTVRDDRFRYIRNFTPERPFLQPNAYKEKQYPVWNLLKELQAEGKLTPEQAVLTSPQMVPEELYDLETDPYEVRSLVKSSDPGHRKKLLELRTELQRWIQETGDRGELLEPTDLATAKGVTKPGSNPNAGQ